MEKELRLPAPSALNLLKEMGEGKGTASGGERTRSGTGTIVRSPSPPARDTAPSAFRDKAKDEVGPARPG